jgi:putative redox protein
MEEVEETNGDVPEDIDCASVAAVMLRCNISEGDLRRTARAGVTGCTMPGARWGGLPKAWSQTMECTINWMPATGMGMVAETGSGHVLLMDGAPDGGGRNLAPRPMETVLAGTGGCTAYDVVLILKRGRHEVTGCQVKVQAERAPVDPKVFTKIHLHFTVSGKALQAQAVERAIQMSHDKYCSATIMLARTAEITTSFEIVEA